MLGLCHFNDDDFTNGWDNDFTSEGHELSYEKEFISYQIGDQEFTNHRFTCKLNSEELLKCKDEIKGKFINVS